MKKSLLTFDAKIWIYPGDAAWHFIHVPQKESAVLSEAYGPKRRGWGSIPIVASIGETVWASSVFPDKRSGTYLLPLKLAVRRAQGLDDGDVIRVTLAIDTSRS